MIIKKQRVLVSVSGGRTSGLMAWLLWTRFKDTYDLVFVFANTSREKEKTLIFINNLTKYFGMPIVWVEAVVHYGKRKGCTHRVVTFETAKRKGEVFEDVIKKYGIPNASFLHCTRELKTNPIRSYMKSIGWGNFKKYITAIGYRADEPTRVKEVNIKENKQWYPLWEWRIKKADVGSFWKKQSFDLGLADYDGNCEDCYKKTDRKIMTQMVLNPSDDWVERMEKKYENFEAGRKGLPPPYRFFRHNQTVQDLKDKIAEGFTLAVDKSFDDSENSEFDAELDETEYKGCAESCEPFA